MLEGIFFKMNKSVYTFIWQTRVPSSLIGSRLFTGFLEHSSIFQLLSGCVQYFAIQALFDLHIPGTGMQMVSDLVYWVKFQVIKIEKNSHSTNGYFKLHSFINVGIYVIYILRITCSKIYTKSCMYFKTKLLVEECTGI